MRGITGERSGRGKPRNINRGLMDTDNGGGLTVGVGAMEPRRAMRKKAGQL